MHERVTSKRISLVATQGINVCKRRDRHHNAEKSKLNKGD